METMGGVSMGEFENEQCGFKLFTRYEISSLSSSEVLRHWAMFNSYAK